MLSSSDCVIENIKLILREFSVLKISVKRQRHVCFCTLWSNKSFIRLGSVEIASLGVLACTEEAVEQARLLPSLQSPK